MAIHRRSVRVICLDPDQRVLLLEWRDPSDGRTLWEPPGGVIEDKESPIEAARRELFEETGLPGEAVQTTMVMVDRDLWWSGERFVGSEPFFLARTTNPGRVRPCKLVGHEATTLLGHRWFSWTDLAELQERVEPPNLAKVLTRLCPDGPWAKGQ